MSWTEADIPDQNGRTAVVTGANGGLGFETARALAARGATVVMASRNMDRAKEAERAILEETPDAGLDVRHLDLASLASVEEFAEGVLGEYDTIDLLVNNAGVMGTARMETADGFELQFGTNHLGHFALTARLLPALLRSPRGRVVAVTSTARYLRGRLDPDDPNMRTDYDPWKAYGVSKTANLQFAIELNRRLAAAGAPVVSLCADPGYTNSNLQQESARLNPGDRAARFYATTVRWVGMDPARGALTLLRAATDPRAGGGELYAPRWFTAGPPVRRGVASRFSDPAKLETLWAVSERETGVDFDVEGLVADA